MKVAKITNTFWVSLLFTILGLLTSCVQGPVNTSTLESKAFPTITSSSPANSSIEADTDDPDITFQIQVQNTSDDTYRIRWYLDNFIQAASNDQATLILPVSTLDTSVGHTLVARLYNTDGSVSLGERSWYISVTDAIGITKATNDTYSTVTVTDEDGTNFSQIGLEVIGSEVGAIKTLKVVYYHKTDLLAGVGDPISPALVNNGDLSDNSMLTLQSYNSAFAIDTDDATMTDLYHKITARVFKFRDESGNPISPEIQIGSDVVWNIKVQPKNYAPSITFADGTTTPKTNESAIQGQTKNYSVLLTDGNDTPANVTIKYEIKRSTDPDASYVELDGVQEIPDTTYPPSCTGPATTATTCSLIFPTFKLIGGSAPVIEQTYTLRATAIDDDGILSNRLIWTIAVTESNTTATMSVSPVATPATIQENNVVTVDFTVEDNDRDNYCVRIVRTTDEKEVYNKCPNDLAAEAFTFTNASINQDSKQATFTVAQDATTAGGTVTYRFELKEMLQSGATPLITDPIANPIEFSINVTNYNVAPALAASAAPLTTDQVSVTTGIPFTIVPGTFTDATANCTDVSPVDGYSETCEGDGLLYYKWQVAVGAASCLEGAWTDIPGQSNWDSGTPIAMEQGQSEATLTWTPPQSMNGSKVCFKLLYKDNGASAPTNQLIWGGAANDFLTVKTNHFGEIASSYSKMAVATDIVAETTYIAYTTGDNIVRIEKRSINGATFDTTLLATQTLDVGAGYEVNDISLLLTGGKLIAAVMYDTDAGVDTLNEIVFERFDTTDITVSDLVAAEQLVNVAPKKAIAMGELVTNGTQFFIPYIDLADRSVNFAQANVTDFTQNNSLGLEVTELTGLYVDINNVYNQVGVENRVVITARASDADGDADWTIASYNIDGVAANISSVQKATAVFSSTKIDNLQVEVVNSTIYAAGLNSNSNNTVAMVSLAEDDYTQKNLVLSIPTVNASNNTVTTSETSNLRNLKIKKRTDLTHGNVSELVIAVQSNLNNIHLLDLDLSTAAWTFKTTGTSYSINNYLLPSSNANFCIGDMLNDFSSGDDGSVVGESIKDMLPVFYESGGTKIQVMVANTERESIEVTSESVSTWHPGFLKTE